MKFIKIKDYRIRVDDIVSYTSVYQASFEWHDLLISTKSDAVHIRKFKRDEIQKTMDGLDSLFHILPLLNKEKEK